MTRLNRLLIGLVIAAAAVMLLSACGGSTPFELAHSRMLPDWLDGAETRVREAYRFALANPEETAQYPCYCGCANIGHRSLLDCFIDNRREDVLAFDQHGAGCGICVDIAQDVMRMLRQGKSTEEIRAYIDATYGHIAPGTGHTGM